MNKLQWLQDDLIKGKLTDRDSLSVFVDDLKTEYTWNPKDLTIGLEYTAVLFIADYHGKLSVLSMIVSDILREIDPRRDANKNKPKYKFALLSPDLWDCRVTIHFKEDQKFKESTEDDHDINIDGTFYKEITARPPTPQPFREVRYHPTPEKPE